MEDNARRLRERAERQGMNVEATVTFHTAWEPLNRQGLVDLMLALEESYRFVVIDTLSRALGRADQMDAADMTVLLGSLQQLASRQSTAGRLRKLCLYGRNGEDQINTSLYGPCYHAYLYGKTRKVAVVSASNSSTAIAYSRSTCATSAVEQFPIRIQITLGGAPNTRLRW